MIEDHNSSEDKLLARVEEVKDRIVVLKEERRKLIEELRKLREERRKLINERRKLIEELRKLREKLAELRENLEKLKSERDKVREETLNKRDEVRIARQLAEREGEVARVSLRRLQRKLEELEWKQMTTVMRSEEERRLIEDIARLESMILKVKEARKHVISVLELEAEYKSSLLKLRDLSNKLREIREEIGKTKMEIQAILTNLNEHNEKVNDITNTIKAKSLKVDEINRELDELYSEYRGTLGRLRDIREARRLNVQLELLEKKRKEIREKSERGEPLTLEELKILYGEMDSDVEE